MQTAQITNTQISTIAIRRTVVCSLIVLTAFGAIIADTLTKQCEANGEVVLELCKKGANGQWVVIDRAKGTISASASVLDVARGKEFKSNLKWDARSEQGRQISIKESGPGKATVDIDRGEVTLEIPYNVNVDGRTLLFTAKLTNRSTSTPIGALTGKKLEVKGASLSASVAGYVEIKDPSVVEQIAKEPSQKGKESNPSAKQPTPGVKEPSQAQLGSNNKGQTSSPPAPAKTSESLIVVIKAQGTSKG